MLIVVLTMVHVVVCLFLIVVVLLQSGQAADLAGAFGGMGSQTTFGARGSTTVLSKATTVAAVIFMVTSLTLAILATRNASAQVGTSVLDGQKAPAARTIPAAPAQVPRQHPLGGVTVTPQGGATAKPIPVPAQPAGPKK